MSEKLNAHKVVDDVATALQTDDDSASKTMLDQVNNDLRNMSEPERQYVANELSLKGLLPDVAIETGLVSEERYVTPDDLGKAAAENSGTVQGMAAQFLKDNYNTMGRGPQDINSDYVKGFDIRYDLALETAQAKREFGGLLNALKQQNPQDADLQERDGLRSEDIDALLAKPESLTEEQKQALNTMKTHFEYMKTPRGVWRMTDWSTPRITESSMDEFVDTGVPLGMREHFQLAEREKSKQAELQEAARKAEAERLAAAAAPAEVKVDPIAPATTSDTVPADTTSDIVPPATTSDTVATDTTADTVPGGTTSDTTAPAQVLDPTKPPVKADTVAVSPSEPAPQPDLTQEEKESPTVQPEAVKTEPEVVVQPAQTVTPEGTVQPEGTTTEPESTTKPESTTEPESTPKPEATPPEAVVPEVTPAPPESTPETDASDKPEEPTPPESMERDKVENKEIEVVQGDNLWKIARAHLTELEGKRPSNADVLKLVNEIVAKNSIKNPNLIYPGQKFIIPGPAAAPEDAPAPAPSAPSAPAT